MALDPDRFGSAPKTILTRAPLVPRGVFAAVGVGVAFGLGIVAGGGMGTARGEAPAAQVDVLALAEQKSRSLDEKRAQLKLTYAGELQKPDAPHVERAIEKQSGKAAAHAPTASVPDEAAAPLEPPPAPVPEEKVPESKPVKADSDDDSPPASENDDKPAPVEKANPERLQQALAKVLGDAPAVVDPKPAGKSFALQVASSPTRQGAEELVKKLAAAGHKARVVEGDVGGKAVFRVRVGSYGDRAAADASKAKLSMPAFVVSE